MSEQKLGPWHPKGINPVRKGVYEVDYADRDGRAFSRWSGSAWGNICWERFGNGTVQDAIERASKGTHPWSDKHRWRGVLR